MPTARPRRHPGAGDGGGAVDAGADATRGADRHTGTTARRAYDGRHKLIWYPAGNAFQLFDLERDPAEAENRAADPDYGAIRARLSAALAEAAWGSDLDGGWVRDGVLHGFDPGPYPGRPDRSLSGQRGLHYPQPPAFAPDKMVGFPT